MSPVTDIRLHYSVMCRGYTVIIMFLWITTSCRLVGGKRFRKNILPASNVSLKNESRSHWVMQFTAIHLFNVVFSSTDCCLICLHPNYTFSFSVMKLM
jgi:hypothetical protein